MKRRIFSIAIIASAALVSINSKAATVGGNNIVVDINNSTGSSQANGTNANIFGKGSYCYSDNCLISGNGSTSGVAGNNLSSSTILGSNAVNTGDYGLVIGNTATNTADHGVAIGDGTVNGVQNNVSVGGRTIGSVAAATTSDQVVNLGQATSLVNTAQSAAKSYTDASSASTLSSAIASSRAYTDSSSASVLTSSKAYSDTSSAMALNSANVFTNAKSVQALTSANGYTDNQISSRAVTYDNTAKTSATLNAGGAAVQLKNVAYATNMTDAANLQNVVDNGNAVLTTARTEIQQAAAQTLKSANTYTDQKVAGIENGISSVNQRLNGVGAMAFAASSLHPNTQIQNDNQIAMSIGTYRGATALAGAVFHYSSDRRYQYNVSFAVGSNGAGAGVSAGMAFGF